MTPWPPFDYTQLTACEQYFAMQRAWRKFRAWVAERKRLGRPVPNWSDVLRAEQKRELAQRRKRTT